MAEYMDIMRIDDWNDLSILDDNGNARYVYDVGELPRADVVERSRYEQLDEEANALSKAYQEEREKYKQLRLNVAKAIEEMDKLASHKVKPISFDQAVAIDMCIEILKRNMGE